MISYEYGQLCKSLGALPYSSSGSGFNLIAFLNVFVTFGFNLSTGKENTMLQPPTGISSFWVADFFFSVVW
jgi:hypothetical protein